MHQGTQPVWGSRELLRDASLSCVPSACSPSLPLGCPVAPRACALPPCPPCPLQAAMNDPGQIKCSLRSLGEEDTTPISQAFGGGGHRCGLVLGAQGELGLHTHACLECPEGPLLFPLLPAGMQAASSCRRPTLGAGGREGLAGGPAAMPLVPLLHACTTNRNESLVQSNKVTKL